MNIGDKIVIKYSGDIVNFGQCYDGMTGSIKRCIGNRYQITLDAKSRIKITNLNDRTNSDWTIQPTIPFQYVYVYNKNLEIE